MSWKLPFLRSIILFFFLSVFGLKSSIGQLIYFSDEGAFLHTVDLSGDDCQVTTLGQMYRSNPYSGNVIFVPSDIAFHPNGNLYATDGFGFYVINLNTFDVDLINFF